MSIGSIDGMCYKYYSFLMNFLGYFRGMGMEELGEGGKRHAEESER